MAAPRPASRGDSREIVGDTSTPPRATLPPGIRSCAPASPWTTHGFGSLGPLDFCDGPVTRRTRRSGPESRPSKSTGLSSCESGPAHLAGTYRAPRAHDDRSRSTDRGGNGPSFAAARIRIARSGTPAAVGQHLPDAPAGSRRCAGLSRSAHSSPLRHRATERRSRRLFADRSSAPGGILSVSIRAAMVCRRAPYSPEGGGGKGAPGAQRTG